MYTNVMWLVGEKIISDLSPCRKLKLLLMCKVPKLNMWPIMNILRSAMINRTYGSYDTTVIVLTVCTTDIHLSESDVVSVLLGRGWG